MIYKQKSAVIFDLDGVIIDSSKVMEIAFSYAFARFFPGETPPFEEYKTHMGKSFLSIMRDMGLPGELHPFFKEKSIELSSQIEMFDGVVETLEQLKRAGCYLGIATGKDSFRTAQILREKSILHYFDKVVSSDMVTHSKPHPESIHLHLKHAGTDAPQTIFIGDSVSDLQCARRAGVDAVAAFWGMGKQEDLMQENPRFQAQDFTELREILLSVRPGSIEPDSEVSAAQSN